MNPDGGLEPPSSPAALGLSETDLAYAAEVAIRSPNVNPRPLSCGAVRRLLQIAFDGAPPSLHSFDAV
jgi:maleylacetate reductase